MFVAMSSTFLFCTFPEFSYSGMGFKRLIIVAYIGHSYIKITRDGQNSFCLLYLQAQCGTQTQKGLLIVSLFKLVKIMISILSTSVIWTKNYKGHNIFVHDCRLQNEPLAQW